MIARLWRGRAADGAKADAYVRHFSETVSPDLRELTGHRGAWLLRRDVDGQVEIVIVTFWESRQSIEAFAGADTSKAVVEPKARWAGRADDFATHFDIAYAEPPSSSRS